MAEAIAFDTHRFVKRLTESGFTVKQAETLADEHVALLNANLATKADVARIEAAVKTDIARLEAAVKAESARLEAHIEGRIEAVKSDLLKWLFGALIAQGGLIVALVKLLRSTHEDSRRYSWLYGSSLRHGIECPRYLDLARNGPSEGLELPRFRRRRRSILFRACRPSDG